VISTCILCFKAFGRLRSTAARPVSSIG
jgi:hypothetical protein